jgi:hypothetical protein
MSALDEDGFLGGRIEAWIREHRASHKDLLTLAETLNRESHAFLHGRAVRISDTRRLTSIVLFARMMELYQAVLLVVDRGSRSGARVLFRAFLEAFFHFAAIHKDSAYLDEYLDQFENERKSLINRIRNTDDPALEDLRRPIDGTLVAEIQNIDIRRVKIEEVARRGGCHNIYVTAYALLSRSVHSSAGDLEAHLALDNERENIVGFRYGPTDEETVRTVGLAGITLAEALREVSKDFDEDRTESCERFVANFKTILNVPSQ